MCGIAGFFPKKNDENEDLIAKMISTIHYRGPDETGIYIDNDIMLGHCRLSIVGIAGGVQPICNEDETLWIVYNGEIFNYPELKSDLLEKGHIFRTDTDTEVLVHLYEEYGKDLLQMVNGQFALAIWDSRHKELFLARDRIGIRPLFYYQENNSYFFASEIKAIFANPAIPREIDSEALHQIFTFWTTITPKTPFKGVFELPPGHYQVVRGGKIIAQQAFWEIPYYSRDERFRGTFADAVEMTRELLLDAIRIRLRADVPVGAYLSGGLDSSIITSLISRNFNNRLRTFSIGFQEAEFDETTYQRELVKHIGTDHSELLITNQDILDYFPKVIWHCEKPLLRTAPVPMFLLAKLTRENNFKVVLTGEGADEVFGGYDIFKEVKIRSFWNRSPQSTCRPLLLEKLHPYIFKDPSRSSMMLQKFYAVTDQDIADPYFSHRIRWNNTGKNRMFFSDELLSGEPNFSIENQLYRKLPGDFIERDTLSRAQLLEMEIFLSNYLLSSQGDRVAMGNSLELRIPFLDYRIINFAMQLPDKWKIRGLNEKYLLKKTFQNILPPVIAKRPKQPYRAPIRQVFFSKKNAYVEEMLSDTYLGKTGYFNVQKTSLLVSKFKKVEQFIASETQSMALVGILSTQILHHTFVENFPSNSIVPLELSKRIDRTSRADR